MALDQLTTRKRLFLIEYRWTDTGIEYEADPRQVEKLISELQLEGDAVKGVVTPGVKVLSHQVQSETALPESEHTRFRELAARAKLTAQTLYTRLRKSAG